MLMFTECDIVMANLSVCLSAHHTLVLYLNECNAHIVTQFPPADTSFLERYRLYIIPRGTPSAGR